MSNRSARTVPPIAVLWDFDGTLMDSEPIWEAGRYELMRGLGVHWDEELDAGLIGLSLIDSGRIMSQRSNGIRPPEWFITEKVRYVSQRLITMALPWAPGAQELLEELRLAGVPCALVTASYRDIVDAVILRIPQGSFQTIVVGDEVSRGKPHPEPYLLACERLGVDPALTVAIEDSLPGTASANAAGSVVLGLTRGERLPDAKRRILLRDLRGIRLADLERFWAEAAGDA